MREKISVGLDIGDSKVVTVIGHRAEGESLPTVIGVGVASTSGMRRGAVSDVEEAVAAISASVEEAERMSGVAVEGVFASITGSHIQSLNNEGMVGIPRGKDEIADEDVVRVIETAQTMQVPASREILHVIPRMFVVDGQRDIKDPVGMADSRLEVDAHVITGSTPFLTNLRKTIEQAEVPLSGLVVGPLADAKAVLTKRQKDLGVLVVNIGAGTTGISVYENGEIYHSAVLPLGADKLTNDLAIVLKVGLDVAEKLKLDFGSAMPFSIAEKEMVDLSKYDPELDQIVPRRLIAEIIAARLQELFGMVRQELVRVGRDRLLPAGAVLIGGGAKLVGIVDSAKEHLALPAVIGFPLELKGVIDKLDDPAYTTAVGLMLWGMDSEDHKFSIPGLDFGKFFDRLKNIFSGK